MDNSTKSVERIYENIWHSIKYEDDGDCISSVVSILASLIHKNYPTTYEDILPFLSSKMIDNIKGIDEKEGKYIKIDKEPLPDEERIYDELWHVIKNEERVCALNAVSTMLLFLIGQSYPNDFERILKGFYDTGLKHLKKIDREVREELGLDKIV
jgi:hypothetical protein